MFLRERGRERERERARGDGGRETGGKRLLTRELGSFIAQECDVGLNNAEPSALVNMIANVKK